MQIVPETIASFTSSSNSFSHSCFLYAPSTCRSKRRHLMDEVSKRCNYLSPIKFISLKFSYIPVLFKPLYRIHIFCLNHTKISTRLLREGRIQMLSIESRTFFAIKLILPVYETHCFLPLLYDELHVLIMKLMSVFISLPSIS